MGKVSSEWNDKKVEIVVKSTKGEINRVKDVLKNHPLVKPIVDALDGRESLMAVKLCWLVTGLKKLPLHTLPVLPAAEPRHEKDLVFVAIDPSKECGITVCYFSPTEEGFCYEEAASVFLK
jgi:hypothetical protein